MKTLRTALGGLLLISLLAACGGTAASATPTDGSSRDSGAPTDVPGNPGGADPGSGGGGGTDGGGQAGGGSGGNPGTGVVDPGVAVPPPNPVPGDDGATIVVPKPGQLDPMPVSVSGLLVNVDGRHVTVRLAWTSGVEPCYTLDSVRVDRDGNTITLTALEGHGADDVACIEIAMFKATIVDLGELEPGTYVIQARGDAPPQTIEIK